MARGRTASKRGETGAEDPSSRVRVVPAPAPSRDSDRPDPRPLLLVLALLALPYLGGLRNDFVWVDHAEIVDGGLVADGPVELLGFFWSDRNNPGYHRPLYNAIHSIDRWIWGLDPFGFHLSSLLLHLGNVALVASVAGRIGMGRRSALALAALFGLHPVNTAVAGLVHSKADLLATMGMLGATALALAAGARRGGARGLWVGSIACFAAALLSKETAFVLPIGAALVAVGPARRWDAAARHRFHRWLGATWAVAGAVAVLRLAGGGGAAAFGSQLPLGERLQTFAPVYLGYLYELVLPVRLTVADTVTAFSAIDFLPRLGVLFAIAAVAAVWVGAWRALPETRVWIAGFHLALLPVAQIVPILHFRADRFLYLPSLLFLGGVVAVAPRIPGALPFEVPESLRRRDLGLAAASVVLALYGVLDVARVRTFRDDPTLFGREVARTPDYLEGHTMLAQHYYRQGDWERADEHFLAATTPRPGRISYVHRDNLIVTWSDVLLRLGQPDRAIELLGSWIDRMTSPTARASARYNLAVAAVRTGRYTDAIGTFREWVAEHPDDASARVLLGLCAWELGRPELARTSFERYLELRPDAPDRAEVEARLAELGQTESP